MYRYWCNVCCYKEIARRVLSGCGSLGGFEHTDGYLMTRI